jgi:hypothetical protein
MAKVWTSLAKSGPDAKLAKTALSSGSGKLVRRSGCSAVFRANAFSFAALCMMAALDTSAFAGAAHSERQLPMHFAWFACEPNCGGWIGAVGVVTGDTLKTFDEFAGGRNLDDATIVLDSSGGSVNDAIALGRRWRQIGLRTTVGSVTAVGGRAGVTPRAQCESMCVFLLLSGKVRYVPEGAQVRVHQIWMENRVENAKAAAYTAQDMMIVERDIGRLAKYTFDMGGTGDLMSLSLDVPQWENLRELSPQELQTTNLVNAGAVADVPPAGRVSDPVVVSVTPKPVQDRLGNASEDRTTPFVSKSTKTAEAGLPTRGVAAVPAATNTK